MSEAKFKVGDEVVATLPKSDTDWPSVNEMMKQWVKEKKKCVIFKVEDSSRGRVYSFKGMPHYVWNEKWLSPARVFTPEELVQLKKDKLATKIKYLWEKSYYFQVATTGTYTTTTKKHKKEIEWLDYDDLPDDMREPEEDDEPERYEADDEEESTSSPAW